MPITHRKYKHTPNDLAKVQNALANWIYLTDNKLYIHVGDIPHRIYNGQRGRYPVHDLMSIWENKSGEIVAFSMHQPRHKLWEIYLHPAMRGGDLEREICHHAEQSTLALMDDDAEKIESACFEADEHRKTLLQAMGYDIPPVDLAYTERSLLTELPHKTLADGFTIRRSTMDDMRLLGDVHGSAFGTAWTDEEYTHVMTSPGYSPEREVVVVAPDGTFAAFTVYWVDTVNRVGSFEPVGVHKDYHRKGLASALMVHVMRLMRDEGMTVANVGHALDNEASTGLYASLGFKRFTADTLASKIIK